MSVGKFNYVAMVGRTRTGKENLISSLLANFYRSSDRRIECVADAANIWPSEKSFPMDKYRQIVVYASSKERFPSVVDRCNELQIPMIVASSVLLPLAESLKFPMIYAPNLSLLVLAVFDVLPRLGELVDSLQGSVKITEAHQAEKTSMPITAKKMADCFRIPHTSINSVRNDEVAMNQFGIPKDYIRGFGLHRIEIHAGGVDAVIETKVLGRSAYASGLKVLLDKLGEHDLQPGLYDANEIVFPEDRINVEVAAALEQIENRLEASVLERQRLEKENAKLKNELHRAAVAEIE